MSNDKKNDSDKVAQFPSRLPVDDPRKRPSELQMRRAAIANALYKAHSKINSAIGTAAFEIVGGADVSAILHMMQVAINAAIEEARLEIGGLAG